MTQVWGEWSLTGVPGAARGIPYAGAMMSALYVPSAGEGSGNVPGRDEFWYEEELRQKARTGAKATTRVRFFWRQDEQGNVVKKSGTEPPCALISVMLQQHL